MCIKLHSDKVVFVLLGITLLAVDGRHTYVRFQRQITDNHGSRASEDIAERHKRAGCETVTHYDVRCHVLCPIYDTVDWKKNVAYWSCTPETTYHCAKDDVTGKYVDACGKSVLCNRGTEPKIKFPEGHTEFAVIICETCSEDGYNPHEFKKSDTFSRCPRRLQCKDYEGEIECEAVTGIEMSWTDSKCRCDIARNYIPTKRTANICTSHYSLACYEMPPCKDTADGRKQQYLSSNYTCGPVCDERFYPRSLESDECVPIKRQDEGASQRNLTNRTISEVHSTPTSTQAPINSSPDDQKNETNVTTQITYAETRIEIWIIMVVVSVGIVIVGLCVLYLYCQNKKKQEGTDSPHEEENPLQAVNHADSPHEEENPLQAVNHADSQLWINSIPEAIRQAELTDIDIASLAPCFGTNWELVAGQMGLTNVEIYHFKVANQAAPSMQISCALHKWKNNFLVSHTLEKFLDILTKSTDTDIDWGKIKKYCEGKYLSSSNNNL